MRRVPVGASAVGAGVCWITSCTLTGLTGGLAPDASNPPVRDGGSTLDASKPDRTAPQRDARAATDVTDAGAPVDAECPIITNVDASVCRGIQAFVGAQVVDGIGNEFCGIAATTVVVSRGVNTGGTDAASSVQSVAYIRAGWSAEGMHMHIHVSEPVVHPPPLADPFFGDAVELFLSPSSDLHGSYGGVGADIGQHIECAAGSPTQPGFAESYRCPSTSACDTSGTVLDGGQFASRSVDGGYELELERSWAALAAYSSAPTLTPGAQSTIGNDFAFDVGNGDGGRLFQSTLALVPVAASPMCTAFNVSPLPFCDDRTWCKPTLTP